LGERAVWTGKWVIAEAAEVGRWVVGGDWLGGKVGWLREAAASEVGCRGGSWAAQWDWLRETAELESGGMT
jgi:hypothetical protein